MGAGTLGQRMLNPNEELQRVGPAAVTARTRAYSAYGCPVNHGSATSTESAGTLTGAIIVGVVVPVVGVDPVVPGAGAVDGAVAVAGVSAGTGWQALAGPTP